MLSKNIVIDIPSKANTHPAAQLVQVACQFDSSVYFEDKDKKVNAKSIMGMMSLSIVSGSEIMVTTSGSDEAQAMEEIEAYLTSKRAS